VTLAAGGANFALYSENAVAVELCLFDGAGEETRLPLTARTGDVWHGFVPGVGVGQRYGYRVHGPYVPKHGDRFNAEKLLVDPYARAIDGKIDYRGHVFGYIRTAEGDVEIDAGDSAAWIPRSVVVDDEFDWGDDAPLTIAWNDSLLYEVHVKGFTQDNPNVPAAIRGTYAGLASEASLAHLLALGVTAVELLPVQEALDEPHLARRGKTNYWGYSTLGWFAPDQRLASPSRKGGLDPVREFKEMVKAFHAVGIEVILDVVYNHTCEGDHLGPTVSLRGIDNRVYYRLQDGARDRYVDWTGCGNTLDVSHPQVLKLILDSLRYWVTEMHVDGFRFDLAPVLGREVEAFEPGAAFFDILYQDPVLSKVKLIAEPWDVHHGGFQLGKFPAGWREWNAKFRDGVRRFWNGRTTTLADIGYRLSGSSDCFDARGKGPDAGINLVTAHDGFTLHDLVSYEEKHNAANGEKNADGWGDNLSINFGVEGPSDDPVIVAARARQVRNLMATLLLTPGVPMIVAGDELGKTQHGNNNPYCLDDATSWIDWKLSGEDRDLLAFVRALVGLRRDLPALRRSAFFHGNAYAGRKKDITWLRPDGDEMEGPDWDGPLTLALGALLAGDTEHLLVVSAEPKAVAFKVPRRESVWRVLVDTRSPRVPFGGTLPAGKDYELLPRSLVLLEAGRPR
jgi:glycogen operon protein